MSNLDVIAVPQCQNTALMSEFTAEAWLDPDLAKAFEADKAGAIGRFARERGYQVPGAAEIGAFELPENPVGDFEYSKNIQAPRADVTSHLVCTTDCPPFSWNCPSVGCSLECPTATTCTVNCIP